LPSIPEAGLGIEFRLIDDTEKSGVHKTAASVYASAKIFLSILKVNANFHLLPLSNEYIYRDHICIGIHSQTKILIKKCKGRIERSESATNFTSSLPILSGELDPLIDHKY
jgi:hypothetical protein